MNERQKSIYELLLSEQQMKIRDLARRFDVTSETIRRDLKALEASDLIKKLRGSVVLNTSRADEVLYSQREARNPQEKTAIARVAASMIKDGETIVFNTGTSTLEIARQIMHLQDLTILTNSITIASLLVENPTNRVLFLGGELRKEGLGTSGYYALEMLKDFYADKAFLSIGGLSAKHGASEYHTNETHVLREMVKISQETIAVCDYTKLNVTALNRICDLDQLSCIITDWNVSGKDLQEFQDAGATILIAQKPADL